MPLLLALGLVVAVLLWEKQGWSGLQPVQRPLPSPDPLGMPPRQYWPASPPSPSSLEPEPVACASSQWRLPAQRDIPSEVTARAVQLLHSSAPLGASFVERTAGRVWRYQVETHGANDQNPKPHRGVGVRLCL